LPNFVPVAASVSPALASSCWYGNASYVSLYHSLALCKRGLIMCESEKPATTYAMHFSSTFEPARQGALDGQMDSGAPEKTTWPFSSKFHMALTRRQSKPAHRRPHIVLKLVQLVATLPNFLLPRADTEPGLPARILAPLTRIILPRKRHFKSIQRFTTFTTIPTMCLWQVMYV
jgi:hypothetical protein